MATYLWQSEWRSIWIGSMLMAADYCSNPPAHPSSWAECVRVVPQSQPFVPRRNFQCFQSCYIQRVICQPALFSRGNITPRAVGLLYGDWFPSLSGGWALYQSSLLCDSLVLGSVFGSHWAPLPPTGSAPQVPVCCLCSCSCLFLHPLEPAPWPSGLVWCCSQQAHLDLMLFDASGCHFPCPACQGAPPDVPLGHFLSAPHIQHNTCPNNFFWASSALPLSYLPRGNGSFSRVLSSGSFPFCTPVVLSPMTTDLVITCSLTTHSLYLLHHLPPESETSF